MKTNLCLLFACLIAVAAGAESRTWTFCEGGRVKFQSGALSFAKGGRIDAEFLRLDGTNVFLKVKDGGDGSVPLATLSEADRAYVAKIKDVPVDVARLEREAQERQSQNRLQSEAMAKGAAKIAGKIRPIAPADYIRSHADNILLFGIDKYEFPETEKASLACKEITSELNQIHRALELGISYNRFRDLLQEKALAVQKIRDLRAEGIPHEFLRHADQCIDRLNESKRDWKEEIDCKYDDLKASYAWERQNDWLESGSEFLYCTGIAEKNPAIIDALLMQEALIVQHEQRAVRNRLQTISDSFPLLPRMTQKEIIVKLRAAVEEIQSKSK